MRASTLFALTAAVLIGLGVAVAAKVGGYFNRQPEVVVRPPAVQILVANRNLFAGDTIDTAGVRVRPAKDGELDAYNRQKDQYLPPLASAGALRVAKVNIEADTPITRDMLKEFSKPTALNERLLPDMRAVNLILSKERSAGGLVQVGEWVEVYMTSAIDGGEGLKTTRTAAIAPKVRVIAKRDSLWPIFAPLPQGKPVEYTLEVNSYRAALIEFARIRGILSLAPLPQSEQKKLEANRVERLAAAQSGDTIRLAMATEADSTESKEAQSIDQEGRVISEADLVKIFDLKVEKYTPEPPPVTLQVERFIGTKRVEAAFFTLDGKPTSDRIGSVGNRQATGAWPPAPYSPNVYTNNGQIIPNNPNAGSIGARLPGNANAAPQWKFGVPDCPSCKKNKF